MAGHKDKGFGATATGEAEGGTAEPILALLRGDEEWLVNWQVSDALGLTKHRGSSAAGHMGDVDAIFGPDTKMVPSGGRFEKGGRMMRAFSKRAVLLIALRSRTPNAAAFRGWLANEAMAKII